MGTLARRNDPGSKAAGRVGGRAHFLSGGAGRGIQRALARSPARRITRLRSEQGASPASVQYADYLVVGRPVTEAADPETIADAIVAETERTTTNYGECNAK